MGDRVSIQFKDSFNQKEPVLFSHWEGMEFVKKAKQYLDELCEDILKGNIKLGHPLSRLEASTVLCDFMRYLFKDEKRIESNYYLAVDEEHGDNSDNGHHIIDLEPYRKDIIEAIKIRDSNEPLKQ